MRSFAAILLVVLSPLFADEAALYVGEVTVETQRPAERRASLPGALEQVLQKLSGVRDVRGFEGAGAVLSRAEDILVSFHYADQRTLLPDGTEATELRLAARFSPPEVDRIRMQLGLPFWEPDRNPLTVWVVIDTGLSRQVLPLEYAYLRPMMDRIASLRGMPLRWPEPGPDGGYGPEVPLLWGGYIEDIADLDAESVLLATARREGPLWNVRINVADEERLWNWRSRSLELEQALVEGLHGAVDRIAASHSIVATDQGAWTHRISVRGMTGEDDYARCLNYLQGLSVVEFVDVVEAAPGRVDFVLRLNAIPAYFERSVQSGSVLEFDDRNRQYALLR